MGTLWERAQCAYALLLSFQEKIARPNGFEPLTPRFVVWWGPLKSLKFVTVRNALVAVLPEFSSSHRSDRYRTSEVSGVFHASIEPLRTITGGELVGEPPCLPARHRPEAHPKRRHGPASGKVSWDANLENRMNVGDN